MKAGAPWSIKGIDPEAREAAKRAAARAGMTLGEWFNHVLTTGDPDAAIRQTAEQAGTASGDMGEAMAADMAPDEARALRAEMEALAASVHALGERLDAAEESTATHVEALAARIEQAEPVALQAHAGDDGAMEALRALAEKVDGIDKVRREATAELQAALRDLAQHTEEVRASSEASITDTRSSLDALSQRIERSFDKSNEAVTTVGKAIEMMAARLSRLEQRMQAESAEGSRGAEPAAPGLENEPSGRAGLAAAGLAGGGAAAAAFAVSDAAAAEEAPDTPEDAGMAGSDRDDWLPESDASATEGTTLAEPEAARWLAGREDDAADEARDAWDGGAPDEAAPADAWDAPTAVAEDDLAYGASDAGVPVADDATAAQDGAAEWVPEHAAEYEAAPATGDETGAESGAETLAETASEPESEPALVRAAAERWSPGGDVVSEDADDAPFDVDAYLDAHLAGDERTPPPAPGTAAAANASADMDPAADAMPEVSEDVDAADAADDSDPARAHGLAAAGHEDGSEAGSEVGSELGHTAEAPAYSTSTIDAFLGQFSDEDGIVLPREEEPYGETVSGTEAAAAETAAQDAGPAPTARHAPAWDDEAETGDEAWSTAENAAAATAAATSAAAPSASEEAGVADEPAGGRRPEDVIAAIRKAARGDDLDSALSGADGEEDPVNALFEDDEDEFAETAETSGGGRKLRIGLVAASIVVLLAGGSYLVL